MQTRLWTDYASLMFEFRCYVMHKMLVQVDIEYCRASTGSWVPVIIVGLLDSLLRGFFWVSCRLWSNHVAQDFGVMRLPPRIASARSCWSAQVEQFNLHHATRTAEQPLSPRWSALWDFTSLLDDVTASSPRVGDFTFSQGECTTSTTTL